MEGKRDRNYRFLLASKFSSINLYLLCCSSNRLRTFSAFLAFSACAMKLSTSSYEAKITYMWRFQFKSYCTCPLIVALRSKWKNLPQKQLVEFPHVLISCLRPPSLPNVQYSATVINEFTYYSRSKCSISRRYLYHSQNLNSKLRMHDPTSTSHLIKFDNWVLHESQTFEMKNR